MNKSLRRLMVLFGLVTSGVLFYMFYNFIGAITLGIFIYYSTRPVYKKLVKRNTNKTLSAALAPSVFILPVLVLLVYTLRIVTVEARALFIQAGDSLFSFVDQDFIEEFIEGEELGMIFPELNSLQNLTPTEIRNILQNIDSNAFESFLDSGLQLSLTIFSSLSGIFFTFLIAFSLAFYLLRDGHVFPRKIYSFTDYDATVTEYMNKLDKDLEVVFFGNILLAIFAGVVGAISFTLLTTFFPGGNILAYPALIGILCGATSLIPVIGMKLVYIPVTAIITAIGVIDNGLSGLLFPVVFFLVAFIIVDTIPTL